MDNIVSDTSDILPLPQEVGMNAWVAYWIDPDTGLSHPTTVYANTIDTARMMCIKLGYQLGSPVAEPITTDDWNDLEVDWERIAEMTG